MLVTVNVGSIEKMVRPEGFEPPTIRLEGGCSIRLSYGRKTRGYAPYSLMNETAIRKMVGVERFELPTSCSQSRRATRLRYTPMR